LLLCLLDFLLRLRFNPLFKCLLIVPFACLGIVLKFNIPIEQSKIKAESVDESG
jgi:hypothetical protein